MTQALSSSLPDGVHITYRRMHFDLDEKVPLYWHSGDPGKTHLFTALSLLFPEGEKFFIDSVRYFEDADLDEKTRKEVREFVKQEAHHAYRHRIYNQMMAAHSLNLDRYEAPIRGALELCRRFLSHKTQLAITVALEHFTAVLANQLLTNGKLTDGMHPAVRPFGYGTLSKRRNTRPSASTSINRCLLWAGVRDHLGKRKKRQRTMHKRKKAYLIAKAS